MYYSPTTYERGQAQSPCIWRWSKDGATQFCKDEIWLVIKSGTHDNITVLCKPHTTPEKCYQLEFLD